MDRYPGELSGIELRIQRIEATQHQRCLPGASPRPPPACRIPTTETCEAMFDLQALAFAVGPLTRVFSFKMGLTDRPGSISPVGWTSPSIRLRTTGTTRKTLRTSNGINRYHVGLLP